MPCRRSASPNPTRRCATPRTRFFAKTGRRPAVFLANLGPVAAFNARATFAANAFAAGGIEALVERGLRRRGSLRGGVPRVGDRPRLHLLHRCDLRGARRRGGGSAGREGAADDLSRRQARGSDGAAEGGGRADLPACRLRCPGPAQRGATHSNKHRRSGSGTLRRRTLPRPHTDRGHGAGRHAPSSLAGRPAAKRSGSCPESGTSTASSAQFRTQS